MASKHDLVLDAVKALIEATLPNARVVRNRRDGATAWPGGEVLIEDGDPGEPEVDLSPLTFNYQRRVHLKFWPPTGGDVSDLMEPVGAACEADRTLGGLAQWLQPEAPDRDPVDILGAAAVNAAEADLIVAYSTNKPL